MLDSPKTNQLEQQTQNLPLEGVCYETDCALVSRLDFTSMELFGRSVWISDFEGNIYKCPLMSCVAKYDEAMSEFCKPISAIDANGSRIVLAKYIEDEEETVKLINKIRNHFTRYIKKNGDKWRESVKDMDMFEMRNEKEIEAIVAESENRKRSGKITHCSKNKNWDGRVVGVNDLNVEIETSKKRHGGGDPSSKRIQRLKNKLEELNLHKDYARLRKEVNDSAIEEINSVLESDVSDRDFIKSISRDQVGIKMQRPSVCYMMGTTAGQLIRFGDKRSYKNRVDNRPHNERTSCIFSDVYTVQEVEWVNQMPQLREWDSFIDYLLCPILYVVFNILYYINKISLFMVGHFIQPHRLFDRLFCDYDTDSGVIIREMYDELLSRKVVGINKDPHDVYKRMRTRYSTFTTINLPAALSDTNVLETTFAVAFHSYLIRNNIDPEDFLQGEASSEEDSTYCTDILRTMLASPISVQLKSLAGLQQRSPASIDEDIWVFVRPSSGLLKRIYKFFRSPAVLVLLILSLFRLAHAEPMYYLPNTGSSNAWVNILEIFLSLSFAAYVNTYETTFRHITDRSAAQIYCSLINGLIQLTTLCVVNLSSLRSHTPLAWIVVSSRVLLISSVCVVLIVLLSRSFILSTRLIVLFLLAAIMQNVFMGQLQKLSSKSFTEAIIPILLSMSPFGNVPGFSNDEYLLNALHSSLTSVPLNAILIALSWMLANLSFIVICYKILQIIMAWIFANAMMLKSFLNLCVHLMTCVFWVNLIRSMLLACLERSSLHLEMASLTSWSARISLRLPEFMYWMRSSKVMMDYLLSIRAMQISFRLPTFLKILAYVLNMCIMRPLRTLVSVGYAITHVPNIFCEILFPYFTQLVGQWANPSFSLKLRPWDYSKLSYLVWHTSAQGVPSLLLSLSRHLPALNMSMLILQLRKETGIRHRSSDFTEIWTKQGLPLVATKTIVICLLHCMVWMWISNCKSRMISAMHRRYSRCFILLRFRSSWRHQYMIVGTTTLTKGFITPERALLLSPWMWQAYKIYIATLTERLICLEQGITDLSNLKGDQEVYSPFLRKYRSSSPACHRPR